MRTHTGTEGTEPGRWARSIARRQRLWRRGRHRRRPASLADDLVGWIARHKLELLAGSIALAGALAIAASVMWMVGEGDTLDSFLGAAAAYVAVAGFVLGLPALAYAMVTDRGVEALTISARERIREQVTELLDKARTNLNPRYELQLFQPNPGRTRLVLAYDPSHMGPEEGWDINPRAPQAVTGSAWVANKYYFLQDEKLSEADLRVTPEQRRRYRDLTGVAATPVQDARRLPIAVVTIFSHEPDPGMDKEDFLNRHIGLADAVARILRAYIGPLDFETVTVQEADERDLDSGTVEVTDAVAATARNSKAFGELLDSPNGAPGDADHPGSEPDAPPT